MSYVNVVNAIEGPRVVVHAGGGNNTSPLTAFAPQQVRVNAGQSVTWDNPSVVGEPHTVTFALDNRHMYFIKACIKKSYLYVSDVDA